jgi:acyl-coenzyme A synthetase/AMP-(fatty) acid ligase
MRDQADLTNWSAPSLHARLCWGARRFVFSEEPLPKTGTGKILKHELREVFWQGKERRIQG